MEVSGRSTTSQHEALVEILVMTTTWSNQSRDCVKSLGRLDG